MAGIYVTPLPTMKDLRKEVVQMSSELVKIKFRSAAGNLDGDTM